MASSNIDQTTGLYASCYVISDWLGPMV